MSAMLATIFTLWICMILSFVLSGMEAGVLSLNQLRIRRLARAGNQQARLLHGFLENPERFLWTILVANTLANFVALGWALFKLREYLGDRHVPVVAAFITITFLFYTFFDLLPKMLFRAYPNRLCLASARTMRLIYLTISPLVFLVEGISRLVLRWRGSRVFTGRLFGNREEMRAVMAEAAQALTSEEHTMVNRVLDLQHFTVAKIAVPLAKTISVDAQAPLAQAMQLARENNLSRLPVWELREGKKCVGGILDVTALLFREQLDVSRTTGEFMSPALFLEEDVRLEIALRRLQRGGQWLAIVLARDGREVGVVALQDILALMFGEVKL
jgi:putative hemolysin